jgi:hypothetical protein
MRSFAFFLACISLSALAQNPAPATAEKKATTPKIPEIETVTTAMKKAATAYRRTVSFNGGYAWSWPQDISTAKGENRSSPSLIMIQPPGTPAMGMAFLDAWQATQDHLYLQAAQEAAQALIWCQLATGGWDSDFDFDPRSAVKYHFRRDVLAGETEAPSRHGASTLDDNKTQSALHFLLELAHTEPGKSDAALQAALKFGMDGLLAAQEKNGGWPQHYQGPADPTAPVKPGNFPQEWLRIWPNIDYTPHYTLNDGNLFWVMKLLLRAHELDRDNRYLDAAKKLGDFLLLARMPAPQPAWAQQYDRQMQPVWARKFEPPAISSVETLSALRTLVELWIATGDEKWLAPVPEAMAWFQRSKLPDGRWARFYELQTNKPLYCKQKSYELTYDDTDLPTHYGFKTDDDYQEDLDQLTATIAKGREAMLIGRAGPTEPRKWAKEAKSLATKVNTALTTLTKKGFWLEDDQIDAGLFVKHLRAMTLYITAARNGGDPFKALLEAEKPRK